MIINSTVGTSSKKDAPSSKKGCPQGDAPRGIHALHFRHTRRHRRIQHTTEPLFFFLFLFFWGRLESLDLETGSTYKRTHTHIHMLASEWIVAIWNRMRPSGQRHKRKPPYSHSDSRLSLTYTIVRLCTQNSVSNDRNLIIRIICGEVLITVVVVRRQAVTTV